MSLSSTFRFLDGLRRGSSSLVALAVVTSVVLSGCTVKHNDANLIAGKQLFVAKCGSCHILSRAGTKGIIGPNLDDAFRRDLSDGFGRSSVSGIVHAQIFNPGRGTAMPARLVTGAKAYDVASYVASVVARSGQDTGLLASAVKAPGAGKPAVEAGGALEIDADPNGQLAYVTSKATGKAGAVTLKMKNASGVQHNIAIEGNGSTGSGPIVGTGGTSQFNVTLKAGTYTYFCQVPGHRQAGMQGTLVVK